MEALLVVLLYTGIFFGILLPPFRVIAFFLSPRQLHDRPGRWLFVFRLLTDVCSLLIVPVAGYLLLLDTPLVTAETPYLLIVATAVATYFYASYKHELLPLAKELALNGMLGAGIVINLLMGLFWLENYVLFIGCAPVIASLLLAIAKRNRLVSAALAEESGELKYADVEVLDYIRSDHPAGGLPVSTALDHQLRQVFEASFLIRQPIYLCIGVLFLLISTGLMIPLSGEPMDAINFYLAGPEPLRGQIEF